MRFFTHFFVSLICIGLVSCADKKKDVDEKSDVEFESDVVVGQEKSEARIGEGNIFEVVGDNESLDILYNALKTTGLDSTLSQGGPYTLLAPTDKALDALSPNQGDALPDSLDQEALKNILLHHVVEGSFSDTEIAGMEELKPMYGDALKVINLDGEITIDSTTLVFSDRQADNGYVHIVDEVIFPD